MCWSSPTIAIAGKKPSIFPTAEKHKLSFMIHVPAVAMFDSYQGVNMCKLGLYLSNLSAGYEKL